MGWQSDGTRVALGVTVKVHGCYQAGVCMCGAERQVLFCGAANHTAENFCCLETFMLTMQ